MTHVTSSVLQRIVLATLTVWTLTICAQEVPRFELSFEPCPQEVVGAPGTLWRETLDVILTTSDNPFEDGALGWSLSLATVNAEILDITVAGTVAASVHDEPPGLFDRGFLRLELTENGIGDCEGKKGALAAVVLSFILPVMLPPSGSESIARIVAQAEIRERTTRAEILFADGCSGSGSPLTNVVVFQGSNFDPVRRDCAFDLIEGDPGFRRGDANDDGAVNLTDVIFLLGCKFTGGVCPECRDAADSNDDGALDVSDAIHTLSWAFRGGPPPLDPGPTRCGADPTADSLPACDYRSCDA